MDAHPLGSATQPTADHSSAASPNIARTAKNPTVVLLERLNYQACLYELLKATRDYGMVVERLTAAAAVIAGEDGPEIDAVMQAVQALLQETLDKAPGLAAVFAVASRAHNFAIPG